jgi:menaquinone-9 beta-reductase
LSLIKKPDTFNLAIAGGGLAGLTLAIQMADAGYSCVLFEKNSYPFHKVCGEYVSLESWNFLERLGLDLSELNLPLIRRLQVSSPSGKLLNHQLDLGGFGISRFLLDHKLAEIAKSKGVILLDNCRVKEICFKEDFFIIESAAGTFYAEMCAGAWGKKSNLDTTMKRAYTKEGKEQGNYVGIKYHIRTNLPEDLIGLHNFEDGYCGISKIENERYCLCYLTNADNLKNHKGDIRKMEKEVLMKNPFLKKYFEEAEFLFEEPLAISQIRIGYKKAVEDHILMTGDTAGNIAPLSGNGMSMAMRSSHELAKFLVLYFQKKMDRSELESEYEKWWNRQFKKRVQLSAVLQKLLKNTALTNLAIAALKRLPFLRNKIVKSTHGQAF